MQPPATRKFGERHGVILVAVHAAGGDEPEAVHRRAAIACPVDCGARADVLVEAPIGDGAVDARQRLIDEPSGADGEMADL